MASLRIPRSLPIVRLDRRSTAGLALASVAALLVLLVTRPAPTFPVLVAGADIPAGMPLARAEVTVRHVESARGLVEGEALGELADWTLAVPLRAGEPLLPSLLRPPERQAAPHVMALVLEEAHAALGQVSSGDLVDLFVTWPAAGLDPPRTELLASGVYVVEARPGTGGLAGRPEVELLVAVDDRLAPSLAAAVRSGRLDLVRRGP